LVLKALKAHPGRNAGAIIIATVAPTNTLKALVDVSYGMASRCHAVTFGRHRSDRVRFASRTIPEAMA
jgi:hypothetical protein